MSLYGVMRQHLDAIMASVMPQNQVCRHKVAAQLLERRVDALQAQIVSSQDLAAQFQRRLQKLTSIQDTVGATLRKNHAEIARIGDNFRLLCSELFKIHKAKAELDAQPNYAKQIFAKVNEIVPLYERIKGATNRAEAFGLQGQFYNKVWEVRQLQHSLRVQQQARVQLQQITERYVAMQALFIEQLLKRNENVLEAVNLAERQTRNVVAKSENSGSTIALLEEAAREKAQQQQMRVDLESQLRDATQQKQQAQADFMAQTVAFVEQRNAHADEITRLQVAHGAQLSAHQVQAAAEIARIQAEHAKEQQALVANHAQQQQAAAVNKALLEAQISQLQRDKKVYCIAAAAAFAAWYLKR